MTPKQKTITLRVAVPEWARWVATDKSGDVYVFQYKPELYGEIWAEGSPDGQLLKVGDGDPRNWRKTLRRIR